MIKLFKLAAVNFLVFLGILIFLNLTAISIYQLSNLRIFPYPRALLPNYKNIEWARTHFIERDNYKPNTGLISAGEGFLIGGKQLILIRRESG